MATRGRVDGLPRSRGYYGGVALGLLCVVAISGAGYFYWFKHRPLENAYATLLLHLNARGSELEDVRSGLTRLRREHESLKTDRASLEERLKSAIAEKEAALKELSRMEAELTKKLDAEIAAGDVLIEQKGDRLVVDVADKVLFAQGAADVSDQGRKVLERVAQTLASVKTHLFEVGGHTDSSPIKSPNIVEQFPTNWELSAARATNVVRFLEEHGVAHGQLVATGYADTRPVARNSSQFGRQRNRRIEIVLSRL